MACQKEGMMDWIRQGEEPTKNRGPFCMEISPRDRPPLPFPDLHVDQTPIPARSPFGLPPSSIFLTPSFPFPSSVWAGPASAPKNVQLAVFHLTHSMPIT